MAIKKTILNSLPITDNLIISREDFKSKVKERIDIGEELVSRPIAFNVDFNNLSIDFESWSDYNIELLKQSFNNPDNNYKDSYQDAGYGYIGQLGEVEGNPLLTLKNLINYKVIDLKKLYSKADLFKSDYNEISIKSDNVKLSINKSEIFIVHGHDELAKTKTARFVEKLGLKPIILHEQTSSGKTIIEKIEEYTNVGFGIVLYTPCDLGCKKGNESNLSKRARQNVVFEHGFLIGKIGRKNVCALVKDDVEVPNDISGVVYVKMDEEDSWHIKIAKELRSSGYDVDMNKL